MKWRWYVPTDFCSASRKWFRMRAGVLVCLLLSGCHIYQLPSDPPPPPVDVQALDDCGASCAIWRARGCSEANPTPAGVSCESVCQNAADNGIDIAKQLSCAQSATTCAALRACPY